MNTCAVVMCALAFFQVCMCSKEMAQLYEDLLYWYLPEVRPVENPDDILIVDFRAYLIQLHDVDEKNQIITTNMWLELQWYDHRLKWKPKKYGNVTAIKIPSNQLWIPDIVLYNNADGKPQVTASTDIVVAYNGRIQWKPPSIFKSFCEIDIRFFPYDEQRCKMKFGMWSYDGQYVDMQVLAPETSIEPMSWNYLNLSKTKVDVVSPGMDLSFYYPSTEWNIINLTAIRHAITYPGCCGDKLYVDVTFDLRIRRIPMFYFSNLLFPCVLLSLLTAFVFCLPANTNQKLNMCLSILVSLAVFFILITEIMPATSLSVPMMGRYLLFNMTTCATSIIVTVLIMNLHYRDATTHKMSARLRRLMLEKIAPLIGVSTVAKRTKRDRRDLQRRRRKGASVGFGGVLGLGAATFLGECNRALELLHTQVQDSDVAEFSRKSRPCSQCTLATSLTTDVNENSQRPSRSVSSHFSGGRVPSFHVEDTSASSSACDLRGNEHDTEELLLRRQNKYRLILRAIDNIKFIAFRYEQHAETERISQEWSSLAHVLDRICLISFTCIILIGSFLIVGNIPHLFADLPHMPIPLPQKPLGFSKWQEEGTAFM